MGVARQHGRLPVHGVLPELDPASDSCLRWHARHGSWVRRSDGGFDAACYRVETIDEATAKAYVVAHHYSGTYPAASRRFGLFYDDPGDGAQLVGVCVFGIPTSAAVLTNVFDLEPYVESLELSRLVLEGPPEQAVRAAGPVRGGRAPANSESWFLRRCFSELAVAGVRGVVSFADPVPRRRADGTAVVAGHVGIVYQASNALCLGRATPRSLLVLPDATTLNDRAIQKVRRRERGHEYVERRLVALGARTPHAGEDMAVWLAGALEDAKVRRLRHRGNWRYAFRLGDRRQKAAVRVLGANAPYPKHPDRL